MSWCCDDVSRLRNSEKSVSCDTCYRVKDLGFRVEGLGFKVQGLRFSPRNRQFPSV